MAKALLEFLLRQNGRTDVEVDSAGTWGCQGEEMAPLARQVLMEAGIDPGPHSVKRVDHELVKRHELIVVMEKAHQEEIVRLYPEACEKVVLLGSFSGERLFNDVADPYGGDLIEYRRCFEQVKHLVDSLYRSVLRLDLPGEDSKAVEVVEACQKN